MKKKFYFSSQQLVSSSANSAVEPGSSGLRWSAHRLGLALTGLALLGAAGAAQAQAPSYAAVVPYSTGGGPFGVAVGDVNADGRPDIVSANLNSNNVSVLLGQAGGTFGAPTNYSAGAGSGAAGVALTDVNGDGRLDIITANNTSNTAGVLLGQAGGTFGAVTTYSTGAASGPGSLALGDVNNDGRQDIVTANFGNGTTSVLLGQAGGTFAASVNYASGGTAPRGVTLGDVNADGRLDIITGIEGANGVGVLLGQAGGTFAAVTTYSTGAGSGPAGVALSDVNGDGRLDIITANFGTNSAGVLLGQVGGTFGAATTYSTGAGSNPYGVALSDVNGDGRLDIITANFGTNSTGVLLGQVGGTFGAVTTFSTGANSTPFGVVVTDVNGDGRTDIITANFGTNSAGVLLNTGTFSLSNLVVSTGTQASPTSVPAGVYDSITVTGSGYGVLAGNVTVNSAVTVQSGGTLNDGCNTISGAGTFTLAAGGTLGICSVQGITASGATGSVQTTGARSFSTDASYVYNGTVAQATGNGLPSQVRSLGTSNNNAVTLSAPVSVAQTLGVSGAGNLVLGSQALTLLSNATGTALVVNNGTGIVSGTATVQRYLDPSLNAGLGYRHLSAPVNNTTVADLATAGFTPEVSQASTYNASATPGTTTPFPTVFGYDQSRVLLSNTFTPFDRGFFVPASTASPLVVGRGYAVNLAAGQIVDFVGQPTSGDQTLTLARTTGPDAGWNLVGNPYPSPLDASLIAGADRLNLDAASYVFESSSQYAGTYRTFVNGVGGNPLVGMAQGVFVRVSTGQTNGTLTFRNSQRVTSYGTQVPVRRGAADARPLVQLDLRSASGAADAFYAYAENGATAAFDAQYDALKLPNTTGLNLTSTTVGNEALAIDGRSVFTTATVLPLTLGVPAAGTYSLAAAALANLPNTLDAVLSDAATGQNVNLRLQPSYSFSVTAAEASAAITGRFTLRFAARTALASVPALTAAEVALYPNPAQGNFTVLMPAVAGATQVQADLLNTLGQVVRRQVAAQSAAGARFAVDATGLAAGVYTLRLQAGATTVTKRVVLQ